MGITKMSNTKVLFNNIDYLNENEVKTYRGINPTGHIPMLEEANYKVFGGDHIILIYLCKRKNHESLS